MYKRVIPVIVALFLVSIFSSPTWADPGDFSIAAEVGPSFEINDLENQFKAGMSFDYELDYGFTLDLSTVLGIGSDLFVFEMLPMLKYNIIYIFPAVIYVGYGMGFATLDKDAGLAMRFSTGINLPLSSTFDAVSDVHFFLVPAGTPGTPSSIDWMVGLRYKFF